MSWSLLKEVQVNCF